MKDDTRTHYETVIQRAVAEIVANLDEALNLSEIAGRAALSPLHFHRIFRGLVGETPLELHRRLRLERAAHRLATDTVPVTRVAFEAGYETHESFTRAFRAAYAASPSEFRAREGGRRKGGASRPRIELSARSGLHFDTPVGSASLTFEAERTAMNVSIAPIAELRVAAVSHEGPYNTISQAFAKLDEIGGPLGLFAHPEAAMIAVYHDDPETTPAAELRSDAGIVIASSVVLPKGMVELRIPAGRYACTTHAGSYSRLGDTWARFMGWLAHSGHRLGPGPAYERYLNTPMTAKPEDLRTDLLISLAD